MYLDDVNEQNAGSDKYSSQNTSDCVYGYVKNYGAGYITVNIADSANQGMYGVFSIGGYEFRAVIHPTGVTDGLSGSSLLEIHGYFKSFDTDVTGYYAPTFVVTWIGQD